MLQVNHRYKMYCDAHGVMPKQMLEYDRLRWPGGIMGGYILWIQKAWTNWSNETNSDRYHHSKKDHENFDKWLKFSNNRPIQ